MKTRRTIIQTIIWALVMTTLTVTAIPSPSLAMLAPADPETAATGSERAADLQTFQRVLENKVVQQRLADLGFTPEEVNAKLGNLSDAQLHQVATQIDALLPGGQDWLILLIVIAILVIIAVVLL